jgi:hypothetical protein
MHEKHNDRVREVVAAEQPLQSACDRGDREHDERAEAPHRDELSGQRAEQRIEDRRARKATAGGYIRVSDPPPSGAI